ncbi:MAG: NUDIX domain-containing protein [Bacteroidota bacterium]|nr:NUDIX domain-containing protein [Flavisolibacter sp.]MBD0365686.1 NUDIX domain-containing protein [Flavisolibacter sp.]MDQ3844101.1 NUDIX domain-containing protein [Bacteroidota bacterium]
MRKSAGILMYRQSNNYVEVFLVHPGGPFWKGKEIGAWSVPKGEFVEGEDPLSAAKREFEEETGTAIEGDFMELKTIQQKGGKLVYAWAVEGDIDADNIKSNTFKQEWPYKSGKWQTFPEVDKAAWFSVEEAKKKINPAQAALIDDLIERLAKSEK